MKYRTIVADPPWPYDRFVSITPETISRPHARSDYKVPRAGEKNVRTLPYASLTVAEIAALPVPALCEERGSALFLWTTSRFLPDAFGVLGAWGFAYRQTLVWHKTNASPFGGAVSPNSAEFVLVGRRGNHRWLGRAASSVLVCARPKTSGALYSRGDHSRKPDAFLDIVEQVSPGPYLELFARRQRLGWDTWGDEALEHVELTA